MNDYAAIEKELFSRTSQGIKFGLERIAEAAKYLRNPQDSYQVIHVAGTNGKGSVCAFIESILRHHRLSTGLFSSPHLVDFSERFLINGLPVKPSEWLKIYKDIQPISDRLRLTFFEISALIAFVLFKRKKVTWAVLETGLGGRLDATNIVNPAISVITNIGIDHTEYLGEDINQITDEKCGIIKDKTPLILGLQDYPEIIPRVEQTCQSRASSCISINELVKNEYFKITSNHSFTYQGIEYEVPLPGSYQVGNALSAVKTIETLGFNMGETTSRGLRATFLPARFQTVTIQGKLFLFDVAHNPQAAKKLCTQIKESFTNIPIYLITGLMADKDTQQILYEYTKCTKNIIITRPAISRAATPEDLAKQLAKRLQTEVMIFASISASLNWCLENAQGLITVTGSFYTVGEAMTELGISPYKRD